MPSNPDTRTEVIGVKVTKRVNDQIRYVAGKMGISMTELLNRAWAENRRNHDNPPAHQ